ncbi:MAG: hypothetical protein KJO31_07895, partial [Gammaproteobacteria bacterium]|nr:hypothetical protein [Gammaproteobacteria bacterium]
SATRVDPFLYESGIETWDKPVDDPWYWAEVRYQIDLGGTREHLWGIEIDMDQDGIDELGITSSASQGNAGGSFAFFKRDREQYRFIGYAFLKTMQILPVAQDGNIRIRSIGRASINCAVAMTLVNDGEQFHPGEKANSCESPAKYERLLGEAPIVFPGRHSIRPDDWGNHE